MYWLRIGLGAFAGVSAAWVSGLDKPEMFWSGITVAMGFYLISFYVARYALYRRSGRENFSKLYTTGIGGFIMLFLFAWVLLFTLW